MSCRRAGRLPVVSPVLTLRGPLSGAAIAGACLQVESLLRARRAVTVAVSDCDLSVVDAVARMRLLARQHKGVLEVLGADVELFEACGLDDVL